MSALLSALALTHTLGSACPDAATVFAGGVASDELCPATAVQTGLTVVDLRDRWVPYPLAGAATQAGLEPPVYADNFAELADGRFAATPEGELAESDRYLELYGVPPTPSRVLAAMDDEERHACHAELGSAGHESLAAVTGALRHEKREDSRARRKELRRARARVTSSMRRLGLESRAELRARGERYAGFVAELEQAEAVDGAIRALQERLRCDGYLHPAARDGDFDWATRQALATFQRRHALVSSGVLDAITRDYLQLPSRELDYRMALRLLRARVADASGLLADGSARGEQATVLGRALDEPALRYPSADEPLEGAAPDTLSPATEAAAEALGWTSFDATRDWLSRHVRETEGGRLVAVPLPERPAHLDPGTRLRVEIDAGGASRSGPGERRPQLTLSAEVDGAWSPLVRWPTTVGGWQDERLESGRVKRKYKASEYGPRHWRQLVVAPVWYPPRSTPHGDLVGFLNGRRQVKEALIGPSYRSAYGLVMLVHDRELEGESGPDRWYDEGIRTHGSANYRSIIRGSSHGCHRLYNVHVLRLANYLLKTQDHEARGTLDDERLRRQFRYRGKSWTISRDQRGFAYEFEAPIPVDVREG